MLKSILVASDISSRATPAVRRAVKLADASGARLTVLHVVEDDLLAERAREEIADADGFLSDQVAGSGAPTLAEVVVVTGHAFHAIGEEERTRDAHLRQFQSTRRELGRFIQGVDLGDLDCSARIIIIDDADADGIAGLVEQAKSDLLVIGTRGLSGSERLFLGSVAQELMGSLEIDVLSVPLQA